MEPDERLQTPMEPEKTELGEVLARRIKISNEEGEVFEKRGTPSSADAIHGALMMDTLKVSPRFGTSNTSTPRAPVDASNDEHNSADLSPISNHCAEPFHSDAEEEPDRPHIESPLSQDIAKPSKTDAAPSDPTPPCAPILPMMESPTSPITSPIPKLESPTTQRTLRDAAQEHALRTNAMSPGAKSPKMESLPGTARASVIHLDPNSVAKRATAVTSASSSASMPECRTVDRGCEDELGDIYYECEDVGLWAGWTCVVTDCRLYYYHEEKDIVQWECPSELYPILGEWKSVKAGSTGSVFWHNTKANLSLWADPTNICDVFDAVLKGNVWFLHLYHEFGGNLRCQHPSSKATVLHYAMCGGSVACVQYLIDKLPVDAVNDVDENGYSALAYGVRAGYWNLCKQFVDAKCSDHTVKFALAVAREIGANECAAVLSKFVRRRVSIEGVRASPTSNSENQGTIFGRFGRSLVSIIRPAVDV